MSEKSNMTGHLATAVTIFIWGTTFISTKVLLVSFTPLEILFFRFLSGTQRCGSQPPASSIPETEKRSCSSQRPASAASPSISSWKTSH